jgi:hypothetical protein
MMVKPKMVLLDVLVLLLTPIVLLVMPPVVSLVPIPLIPEVLTCNVILVLILNV